MLLRQVAAPGGMPAARAQISERHEQRSQVASLPVWLLVAPALLGSPPVMPRGSVGMLPGYRTLRTQCCPWGMALFSKA